eukprot:TRINITY_DN47505_c0_g1_i2.p1 TRINITY_DN47505_c0_g1~~TRINITY_DN47505_c0_g1_i2.p1  ORF type:complete len:345 (+),score=62.01 TRINITY_DN47505_c0_g1_i2:298-1332(+)
MPPRRRGQWSSSLLRTQVLLCAAWSSFPSGKVAKESTAAADAFCVSGRGGCLGLQKPLVRTWTQPGVAGRWRRVGCNSGAEAVAVQPRRSGLWGLLAVLRGILFVCSILLVGCFGALLVALLKPFAARRDAGRLRVIDQCVQAATMLASWPFVGVTVLGEENLPPVDQPCVYVANHQSFLDIVAVMRLPRTFKFISKASILKLPIIGFMLRSAQHVMLAREDQASQIGVFRDCLKKLKKGASLFIFPEATRSRDGTLQPFKARGAFSMARRAKVPLVPITVTGTGRLMPPGREYQLFPSGAGARVIVHSPIPAEDVAKLSDDELLERARSAIASALPAAGATAP